MMDRNAKVRGKAINDKQVDRNSDRYKENYIGGCGYIDSCRLTDG